MASNTPRRLTYDILSRELLWYGTLPVCYALAPMQTCATSYCTRYWSRPVMLCGLAAHHTCNDCIAPSAHLVCPSTGFSEFAVFVLPHINPRRWWAMLMQLVGRRASQSVGDSARTGQPLIALTASCAVCGTSPPWLPHTTCCCDVVYCYYCAAALLHDTGYIDCKGCFASVPRQRLRPCRTDAVVQHASPPTTLASAPT